MESWSHVSIFHSGDEYYQNLVEDIRKAEKSVTIESYIFAVDKLTELILKELDNAAKRGCNVKLIVDGFGSYYYIPSLEKICSKKGIELRVFHPFPYPLSWLRNFFSKRTFRSNFFIKKINRRTHRKICIIDEKKAYLGSFNFIQNHSESIMGARAWRDTGVCVEGPPVRQLVLAFQITYLRTFLKGIINWTARWKLKTDPFEKHLRLNTTQKSRRRLYKDLLMRIHGARHRVYITTAYFVPRRSLLRALLKAARRGVDVQILIPGKSDVLIVKWAAFYIVKLLLQRRIPIFEYQKTILHAKTMILDNQAFIGSFNLNHRSILHDLEVEVILKDEKSLENMLYQWSIDVKNSKSVSEKDFMGRSWVARLLYKIAFRLRYML